MGTVLFLYFKAQINQLHVSPSACFRNILNEVPGIEKVSVHLQYIFSAEEAFREHLEFQNSTNHIFQLSKIIFVLQQPLYHDHDETGYVCRRVLIRSPTPLSSLSSAEAA